MQGKSSESRLKRKMELDRISNLPSDVMDQILSSLPMKEAWKTSVLSSKWRYKTATLPHLVFDNQCFPTKPITTFKHIVDQVLVLHVGPIHTFKLIYQVPIATGHIVRWILHLSRNVIKEFIFDVWRENPYKMPSCFFSCQHLVSLTLYNCLPKPPSTFKGFRSLNNLYLHEVTIDQDVLQTLIVCCPLLERLVLRTCRFTHLNIDAPNLQFFEFVGSFEDLNLENMFNLVEVCIDLDGRSISWVVNGSSHLVKFFVHLPLVRRITIQNDILQYLTCGALPEKLLTPYVYLNFISIAIGFCYGDEVLTAQCLLGSAPALQELKIQASSYVEESEQEVNSWYDDNQNFRFSQLQLGRITNISGSKAELDIIRFLLLSSPVLERMTVEPASDVVSSKLLKELVQFRRASARAEIIYLRTLE